MEIFIIFIWWISARDITKVFKPKDYFITVPSVMMKRLARSKNHLASDYIEEVSEVSALGKIFIKKFANFIY